MQGQSKKAIHLDEQFSDHECKAEKHKVSAPPLWANDVVHLGFSGGICPILLFVSVFDDKGRGRASQLDNGILLDIDGYEYPGFWGCGLYL